jgi:acyl carrier protein
LGASVEWDSSLREDLAIDSLDLVELLLELEEQFGVTIPDHEAEQIKTIADAIRLIERYRGGEAA